jgi:hypothetical protein
VGWVGGGSENAGNALSTVQRQNVSLRTYSAKLLTTLLNCFPCLCIFISPPPPTRDFVMSRVLFCSLHGWRFVTSYGGI